MRTFRTLAVFSCLLACSGTAAAQNKIPWLEDWRQARDLAQQQQRLVLLHFWSETCAPCLRLEQQVFNRSEVARAMGTGYIPVKVNVDKSPELAKHYRVTSWPTDVIVDANGRVVHRQVCPQDPNQYIALLDSVKAQYGVNVAANSSADPGALTNGSSYGGNLSLAGQPSPPRSNPQSSAYMQASQSTNRYSNSGSPSAGSLATNQPQTAPTNQPYVNPYTSHSAPAPSQQSSPEVAVNNRYSEGAGAAAPNQSTNQSTLATNAYAREAESAAAAGNNWAQQVSNPPALPTEPTIVIDGYCPVTLVEKNTWTRGDKRFGAVHRGRTYLFTSYVNQQRFLANPDRYSPLLSGFDVVRYFSLGEVVSGKREHGLYYGDLYFLFADEVSLEQFRTNPQQYVQQAQAAMQQNR